MVSELMDLARRRVSESSLRMRAPDRFSRKKKAPQVAVWNVNGQCNMTCPHCYASAGKKAARDELTFQEGVVLLDQLKASGVRVVIFSGGEPLLREDLPELIRHADVLGLMPQLSTNGALIDPARAAMLKDAGIRYVGISIDGPREFNDRHRGLEGGYDLALAGIRNAREAGMKTGLRMTLMRENLPFLPQMVEAALEIGADRFYLSHLMYSGRGSGMTGQDLNHQEARETLFHLFEMALRLSDRAAPLKIVTGSNDSDGPLLLLWLEQRLGAAAAASVRKLLSERGGNSAGEKIINIDFRGRVHPDQFWQGANLGNVRETPLERILEHELLAALQDREARLVGRCAACQFLTLCRGSHRERALAIHGDLWAPDPSCVMEDHEIAADKPATMEYAL